MTTLDLLTIDNNRLLVLGYKLIYIQDDYRIFLVPKWLGLSYCDIVVYKGMTVIYHKRILEENYDSIRIVNKGC